MEFLVEESEEVELQESTDPRVYAIAGASAGLMEHCGMFPIDTVKTHQQLLGTRGIMSTVRSIVSQHGALGLFRGLPVVAIGAAPVHGLSFTIYEFTKRVTGANQPGHHLLASSMSGIAATLAHDACLAPIDTIKQKLQFGGRPYKGVFDCLLQTLREGMNPATSPNPSASSTPSSSSSSSSSSASSLPRQGGARPGNFVEIFKAVRGVGALYRGYTTTTTMNVPYAGVYFGAYESMKKIVKKALGREDLRNDPVSHMLAGAAGGCLAAAFTNPLDVSKTRLQVGADLSGARRYRGMLHALRVIWQEEGMNGYTRGIKPRMIFHSMSAAISWTTYEYVKHVMEAWVT